LAEVVKSSSEINSSSLSKIGFTKINGFWVSKSGDPAPSTGKGQEEQDATEVVAATTTADDAGPSEGVGQEIITTMSPFERLMINRMDTFAENQRNLYDFCESRFN